jgi:hypothetical protein
MQTAGKLLEITQQKICSGSLMNQKTSNQKVTSSSSSNVNKCIELLFSKFAAWYGHIWRSQFKDEAFLGFAKKEWQEGLSDFSDVVLNQAMISCRDHYEFPPTLPQMIHHCRQINKQNTFFVSQDDYVPPNPALVESCLQQCKSFLTQR